MALCHERSYIQEGGACSLLSYERSDIQQGGSMLLLPYERSDIQEIHHGCHYLTSAATSKKADHASKI